jgi:hypothetical protein
VGGTIESGMPKRSLTTGLVLGVATALAVAVAGLLLVLPIRAALAVSRRADFDDVDRILDRVWGEVRADYAGVPPIARRLSPQAKGLLATGLSCGATAGLWFGAQGVTNNGLSILLVVLACVAAVVSFGCVVGTLFFVLVPGATTQRPPPEAKPRPPAGAPTG